LGVADEEGAKKLNPSPIAHSGGGNPEARALNACFSKLIVRAVGGRKRETRASVRERERKSAGELIYLFLFYKISSDLCARGVHKRE
jgi:hypothetical protein